MAAQSLHVEGSATQLKRSGALLSTTKSKIAVGLLSLLVVGGGACAVLWGLGLFASRSPGHPNPDNAQAQSPGIRTLQTHGSGNGSGDGSRDARQNTPTAALVGSIGPLVNAIADRLNTGSSGTASQEVLAKAMQLLRYYDKQQISDLDSIVGLSQRFARTVLDLKGEQRTPLWVVRAYLELKMIDLTQSAGQQDSCRPVYEQLRSFDPTLPSFDNIAFANISANAYSFGKTILMNMIQDELVPSEPRPINAGELNELLFGGESSLRQQLQNAFYELIEPNVYSLPCAGLALHKADSEEEMRRKVVRYFYSVIFDSLVHTNRFQPEQVQALVAWFSSVNAYDGGATQAAVRDPLLRELRSVEDFEAFVRKPAPDDPRLFEDDPVSEPVAAANPSTISF